MKRKSARSAAEAITAKLHTEGFTALLAGGCVRDLLLQREPDDYDVATNARPDQICAIYPKAQKVGAHFGVVIVRQFGHNVEVATFRTDNQYLDGRHPESVTFATDKEDALRRDFTINGMFYNPQTHEIIDYVGGQDDLNERFIRAIGEPEKRFEEDHLRMLRAIRFASRLGFHIEQDTFEAIHHRADKISRISAERIREELEKILRHPNRAAGFQMLAETNLLPHLWSSSDWNTMRVQKSHLALQHVPERSSFTLAFATLLHHHLPQQVRKICTQLRGSKQFIRDCHWLVQNLHQLNVQIPQSLASLKLLMQNPNFEDLLHLYEAYLMTEGQQLEPLEKLRERAGKIPGESIAPAPWITGEDLLRLNIPQGPAYSRILEHVYCKQLNDDWQDRAQAVAYLEKIVEDPEWNPNC